MTNIRVMVPLLGVALMAVTGCSHTSIVGEGRRHEQVVQGTIGLMGEDNEITLLAGSDVPKLSIMGEGNRVIVRDGAWLQKVEIIGEDNEVVCPAGQAVEYTAIGEDNRLRYRGAADDENAHEEDEDEGDD